jgi:hypothetical protein
MPLPLFCITIILLFLDTVTSKKSETALLVGHLRRYARQVDASRFFACEESTLSRCVYYTEVRIIQLQIRIF